MKLNIKTEKKYIWLLGYCFILASIIEVRTYRFLVTAGIVVGDVVTANPIIHYGGTILLAIFACLLLVKTYEIVEEDIEEDRKEYIILIGVFAVSVMVLLCTINLWRLLACMY